MSGRAPARRCSTCTGTSSAVGRALRTTSRRPSRSPRPRSEMTLVKELEQEVREAMLARDTERRDALRLILSSLRSAEKELLRPLTDDEELQVLQRERKKRNEAADAFRAAGRNEQAAKEEGELAILEEFMPEPLSEEEID